MSPEALVLTFVFAAVGGVLGALFSEWRHRRRRPR